jgi:predicted RNase H-like HicB family nuclease
MTNYRIHLVLEPNPGGVFTVTSPDVPGWVTEGTTAAEIQANVQDALETLFEAWAELGKPIPSALQPLVPDRAQTIETLVTAA